MKHIKKIRYIVLALAILLSLMFSTASIQSLAASGKWKHNSKGYYYVNADGTKSKNCWQTIGGKKYYFNAKGYRVTGWKKISEKKYYFVWGCGVLQARRYLARCMAGMEYVELL
ncbi:MAG: hypothetical protein K6E85_10450 [Lachnospiraceae bacterium]|nr:hypothetical protein [Lachnospiraceae bacterium]